SRASRFMWASTRTSPLWPSCTTTGMSALFCNLNCDHSMSHKPPDPCCPLHAAAFPPCRPGLRADRRALLPPAAWRLRLRRPSTRPILQPHGDASLAQILLERPNLYLPEVEDAGRQHGIGPADEQ